MGVRICSAVLLAAMCAFCTANADTYTLSVPCAGQYGPTRYFDINFGVQLISVQRLTMHWSGYVVPGWWTPGVEPGVPGPWPGQFLCALSRDTGGSSKWVYTDGLGATTYPNPEFFGLASEFTPVAGDTSWGFLLDGCARMYVQFAPAYHPARLPPWPPWGRNYPPVGYLDSATLVLQATPVPEPLGSTALAVCVCGYLLRRRGQRRSTAR